MIQLNRDDSLFGGLVVSFAVVGSLLVSSVWTPPAVPDPAPPQNIAVRFAIAAPAPAPAGTTARQAVKAPAPVPVKPKPKRETPKPPPKPAPEPLPPADVDSDSPVLPEPDTTPPVIPSTATLEVPQMLTQAPAQAPTPASDALPPLAVSAPPTTPPPGPDDPDAPVNPFPVKPYGNTVVVAFRINSDGVILDSRILVPSWNALGDMSIRLAASSNEAKSIRYTNINPPLQPGETRWIVLPHDWKNPGENSLP